MKNPKYFIFFFHIYSEGKSYLPSGLAQMKTRTLLPVGTWNGGSASTFPLMAALRRADSRGQGCLLPTTDGHMGGDFQRGCKQNLTTLEIQDWNGCMVVYGHTILWNLFKTVVTFAKQIGLLSIV